jgi:citrate lyase beta subunit
MTESFRPRRSILYLPAANPRALAKVRTLDIDCVILDLEDAVAPEAKVDARAAACAAIAEGGWGRREVGVRVNSLGTSWSTDDFAAASASGAAFLVVPKIDSAREAEEAVLRARGVPVWAMIETPKGVLDAPAIAEVDGVTALLAGMADLTKDLRAKPGPDRAPLAYALSRIVLAARAAEKQAFDGVFVDLADTAGFEAETAQGVAFGFDGKSLVHPSQIETANRLFAPAPAEIDFARGLIAAFEAGQAAGKGVTTYQGKMIELLHVGVARRTLAVADAIAARG